MVPPLLHSAFTPWCHITTKIKRRSQTGGEHPMMSKDYLFQAYQHHLSCGLLCCKQSSNTSFHQTTWLLYLQTNHHKHVVAAVKTTDVCLHISRTCHVTSVVRHSFWPHCLAACHSQTQTQCGLLNIFIQNQQSAEFPLSVNTDLQ